MKDFDILEFEVGEIVSVKLNKMIFVYKYVGLDILEFKYIYD